MSRHFPRHVRELVLEALSDTPVTMLMGARQVGKSTLVRDIVSTDHPAHTVNLDDQAPRRAALDDPEGFIGGLPKPVLIDEVQRGGLDLVLAIKSSLEKDRTPGSFLLTGSANILSSKEVQDALTGRIERVQLWPLEQSEIYGGSVNFVDSLLSGSPPQVSRAVTGRDAFADLVVAGGYPEARTRIDRRRGRWFKNYIELTLEKDLADVTDAYKLEEMPRLLRALAARAANLIVYEDLAKELGIDRKTVKAYIRLLELIFVIKVLPAWRPGIASREQAAPKAYIADSGMQLNLIGADAARLHEDGGLAGQALENFVAMEILRHAGWAQTDARAWHYRRSREEIDLILEDPAGRIACVEVKAAVTLGASDWRTLKSFRDRFGERFAAGVIIHTGAQTVPLGDRLWAVPVSALWA